MTDRYEAERDYWTALAEDGNVDAADAPVDWSAVREREAALAEAERKAIEDGDGPPF